MLRAVVYRINKNRITMPKEPKRTSLWFNNSFEAKRTGLWFNSK
jgi:hypothetical protein